MRKRRTFLALATVIALLFAGLVASTTVQAVTQPAAPRVVKAVSLMPVEPAVHTEAAEKAAMAKASINDCIGSHSIPCLTVNPAYWTGNNKTVVPASGYCPCPTRHVMKRAFAVCNDYELRSVQLCFNGQVIFVNGYAACVTRCTITGLRGYHHCGIPGTGAAGWSLDQIDCSDSYLGSQPSKASVVRNTVKMCFVRIATCDTNAFHVNVYPSGGVYGPYNGVGSYS